MVSFGGDDDDGFSTLTTNLFSSHHFCSTDLKKHPVEGFSAGLCDDSDIYSWEVLIIGPPDTL